MDLIHVGHILYMEWVCVILDRTDFHNALH